MSPLNPPSEMCKAVHSCLSATKSQTSILLVIHQKQIQNILVLNIIDCEDCNCRTSHELKDIQKLVLYTKTYSLFNDNCGNTCDSAGGGIRIIIIL